MFAKALHDKQCTREDLPLFEMMRFRVAWATILLAASSPIRMARSTAGFTTIYQLEPFSPVLRKYHASPGSLHAKPKQGSAVDSYQTVSVNCAKCQERLFRYKKKNGTKSNLVKCYIERIAEDSAGLLAQQETLGISAEEFSWECPSCQTQFARPSLIHGRPALKMVGGKVRMTKK